MAKEERDARLARGEPCAWRLDMKRALAGVAAPLSFIEASSGMAANEIAHPENWGDVVLSRKDIATSYHMAVIFDDARQAITHVVRGRDLFHATAIHRLLQHLLDLPAPVYFHHALIGDDEGRKLSKSLGSRSLSDLRAEGVSPADIRKALGF
jgi:glutamyl-Q tRNA(Asp) synthetase